jgi:hypothetical protein
VSEKLPPAGFYPDPQQGSGKRERFWDGKAWTERTRNSTHEFLAEEFYENEENPPPIPAFSELSTSGKIRNVAGITLVVLVAFLFTLGPTWAGLFF